MLEQLAAKTGSSSLPIPVGLDEMQNQSAQWLQIRRERPDYVVMWGWGAMNAGAITEAVKTRYPMDNFVGIWWAGHDDDLQLVGEEGKGYRSISWSYPNLDAPVHGRHQEPRGRHGPDPVERGGDAGRVLQPRARHLDDPRRGHPRRAGDTARRRSRPTQLRWGLENLNITEERLDELGMTGMVPPFPTTCANHTGHSGGWMLEWDGEKFVKVSDHLTAESTADRRR